MTIAYLYQRALESGFQDIIFEPGRCLLNTPLNIPSQIQHIDLSLCDLVAGSKLKSENKEGFIITGQKDDPTLFIERLLAWKSWNGMFHVVQQF